MTSGSAHSYTYRRGDTIFYVSLDTGEIVPITRLSYIEPEWANEPVIVRMKPERGKRGSEWEKERTKLGKVPAWEIREQAEAMRVWRESLDNGRRMQGKCHLCGWHCERRLAPR